MAAGCEVCVNFGNGADEEGFVEFSDFAGDAEDAFGAEGFDEVVDELLDSVGGFVEGEGGGGVLVFLEEAFPGC